MIPSKALTASLARTTLRDPSTLFFSYVFPSALLVILAQTMGSYPGVRGHSVVDSIGPNVVGIGVTFVGLFAGGMNIAEWRENKMLGVLRCVPLSVSRILMSAFTVALVSAFVQAVLIIVVGIMPWVGMSLSPWALLAVVPVFLGPWCSTLSVFSSDSWSPVSRPCRSSLCSLSSPCASPRAP